MDNPKTIYCKKTYENTTGETVFSQGSAYEVTDVDDGDKIFFVVNDLGEDHGIGFPGCLFYDNYFQQPGWCPEKRKLMLSVINHGGNNLQYMLREGRENGQTLWESGTFETLPGCHFSIHDIETLVERFK